MAFFQSTQQADAKKSLFRGGIKNETDSVASPDHVLFLLFMLTVYWKYSLNLVDNS